MIVFFAWSRYLWRDREIAPTFAKKFDEKRDNRTTYSFKSVVCFTVILQMAPLPSRLTAAMENDIIAAI